MILLATWLNIEPLWTLELFLEVLPGGIRWRVALVAIWIDQVSILRSMCSREPSICLGKNVDEAEANLWPRAGLASANERPHIVAGRI